MLQSSTSKAQILHFPLPDLNLVWVAPGTFKMGDAESGYDREKPVRAVEIVDGYYMGQYQVTQALYYSVMKRNPSYHKGQRRPVERVSWHEAKKFISTLNNLEFIKRYKKERNLEGFSFRLPSEAEWEYAARGGTQSQGICLQW